MLNVKTIIIYHTTTYLNYINLIRRICHDFRMVVWVPLVFDNFQAPTLDFSRTTNTFTDLRIYLRFFSIFFRFFLIFFSLYFSFTRFLLLSFSRPLKQFYRSRWLASAILASVPLLLSIYNFFGSIFDLFSRFSSFSLHFYRSRWLARACLACVPLFFFQIFLFFSSRSFP